MPKYRFLSWTLLSIGFAAFWAPSNALAQAKAPYVYYSYEQVGFQEQATYALVPRTGQAARGLAWADLQKVAYGLLRSAKAPTYGETTVYVNPDRSVTVNLDESKKPYFPIIVGEVVYTLTELGAASVSFPAIGQGQYTRDKVDTPAYIAVLPLWRALPPQPRPMGLIRMNDGKLIDSSEVAKWIETGDKRLIDFAVTTLRDTDDRIVRAGLACLTHLKAPGLQGHVAPLLKHSNADIRLIAANTMTGTRQPKLLEALTERVQKDDDSRIRALAARILQASGDPRFSSFGLFHVLNGADTEAATDAAKKLGDMKLRLAVPELAKAARSKHAPLRVAAVEAIAKIGDTNVLKDLLGFSDIDAETKLQAARVLAALPDQNRAQNGLVYLLLNGKGDDSATAATRIGEMRSGQAVHWLIQSLKHSESKTRRAAATALAKLADPRALAPLAEASESIPEDADFMSQQVIGIMSAQSLQSSVQLSSNPNVNIRRLATESLGHHVRKNPRSANATLPILAARVADASPKVRTAALNALGIMGDSPKSLPLVLKSTADPAPAVRAAAAAALGSFAPPQGSKELVALISDEEDQVRLKAIDSCRVRKEESAVVTLVNYRGHRNPDIKRLVIQTLAAINPPALHKSLREVFSESVFDQDPEVRLAAVQGLKVIRDPRVLDIMSVLLQDPDERVKVATLKAYGDTGFPQAIQPLLAALQDETQPGVKMAALDGLLTLKAKDALPTLKTLRSKEPDKKVEAKYAEIISQLTALR